MTRAAARTATATGAAGLAYVAAAGIENMEALGAPRRGDPVAEIRAAYADEALNVVTTTAGALSLVAYALFAVGLAHLLASASEPGRRWARVVRAAGVAAPAIAAVGVAAEAALVLDTPRSDDDVGTLFDVAVVARLVTGPLVAAFLAAAGLGALRSGAQVDPLGGAGGRRGAADAVLPGCLARLAIAIAVPLAVTPIAAASGPPALEAAAAVAFGAGAVWVFLASLWLVVGRGAPFVVGLRDAAFLTLVIAAGLVGLGLLAVPSAAGTFFSWGLEPAPLAAFAGGAYVGAAVVYAAGIGAPWRATRGLIAGAVVLSVSVLTFTLVHLEVFDLDRLQAWAWLALFAAFSAITIALLVLPAPDADPASGAPLPRWARALLGVVAAVLGGLALALWIDPAGFSDASPFALPPLGGRFAGSWIALLAVLAGWGAGRGTREEARLPALALVALPAGALVAAARTAPDLDGGAGGYVAALVALVLAGAASVRATRS
jgi:hypothetical protein